MHGYIIYIARSVYYVKHQCAYLQYSLKLNFPAMPAMWYSYDSVCGVFFFGFTLENEHKLSVTVRSRLILRLQYALDNLLSWQPIIMY